MKKTGVLNRDISDVIASMGHRDQLVICDAGLPIPEETRRIDLALREGIPGFINTVLEISKDLEVEEVLIAEETKQVSPEIDKQLNELFKNATIVYIKHEELKNNCNAAKAVIRTGEFTPYANVILVSGVIF